MKIEIDRIEGDFGFEATDDNAHKVHIDSSLENGGSNFGARPMQLLLMGLGGCSGIDIVAILKKQRQKIDNFKMSVEGEREADKMPSLWKTIHITFELTGDIDLDKAKRACQLSMEKYCSVAETLRKAGAEITWDVKVNS
jgi:putative redox protein